MNSLPSNTALSKNINMAISFGELEELQDLMSKVRDEDHARELSSCYCNPIVRAVESGQVEALVILSSKFNILSADSVGIAEAFGHQEVVELLKVELSKRIAQREARILAEVLEFEEAAPVAPKKSRRI